MTTMRDLFSGVIPNPTLRELAAEDPPHTIYEQTDGAGLIAMSPGAEPSNPEAHPAYPKALVADAQARRARVRARLEAEANGTHVEPPVKPFDEVSFHEDNKYVSSAPANNVTRGDVWPWPDPKE